MQRKAISLGTQYINGKVTGLSHEIMDDMILEGTSQSNIKRLMNAEVRSSVTLVCKFFLELNLKKNSFIDFMFGSQTLSLSLEASQYKTKELMNIPQKTFILTKQQRSTRDLCIKCFYFII